MRYVCLVYYEPAKLFALGKEGLPAFGKRVAAYSEQLKSEGAFVMGQALSPPNEAVSVRRRDDDVSTTDGPFMETKEILAGFFMIDARDLNDALRMAAGDPHAEIGCIEVRPLLDLERLRAGT